MWKLTDDQKHDAVRRYVSGESATTMAHALGVSGVAIRGVVRRRGVTIRSNAEAHRHRRLNHEALTGQEDAAYWVGFLFADGTVAHRSGSPEIALVLSERDRQHLESFRAFLGSDHAITRVARYAGGYAADRSAPRFAVRSATRVACLEAMGWRPRLQHRARDTMADSPDFWRGLVDGDGWVGVSRGKTRLELVGGERLLAQFVRFLNRHGIAYRVAVRRDKSIYRVGLGGRTAANAVALLYDHATVALPRKRNAARNIQRLGHSRQSVTPGMLDVD